MKGKLLIKQICSVQNGNFPDISRKAVAEVSARLIRGKYARRTLFAYMIW